MTNHETAGANFASALNIANILDNYMHYPRPIRSLILSADTQPFFRDSLSKSFHSVWLSLVSRIQIKNPEQPIKVRLSTVAESLGISDKTVQRAIKTFVIFKWIRPAPEHDGRDRFGRYSYREFVIEENTRLRLGIKSGTSHSAISTSVQNSQNIDSKLESVNLNNMYETEVSDGDVYNQTKASQKCTKSGVIEQKCPTAYTVNVNLNKDVKKIYEDFSKNLISKEEFQNIKPQTKKAVLPESLEILRELNVFDGAICKLRHLARVAGLRLEDVWGASWEYVMKSNITGGRLVKYLSALISIPDDYKGRAEQISRSTQTQNWTPNEVPKTSIATATVREKNLIEIEMKAYSKKYSHRRFKGSDGSIVRVFDGTAEVIKLDRSCFSMGGYEAMSTVYKNIEQGLLVEIIA